MSDLISICRLTKEDLKKLPQNEWLYFSAYFKIAPGIDNNVAISNRTILSTATDDILQAKHRMENIEVVIEEIKMGDV